MTLKTKVSNLQNKNRLGILFKENTSYSKLSEVKLITIGLASPERIKQWAEKTLPNGKILGEVINANTLHHKTFKPQKGGLFCERIFGPLKDFECACGKPLKYKKQSVPLEESSLEKQNGSFNSMKPVELSLNKSILGQIGTKTRNFCNICEVEYTWSVMRRYQLGYIKLISPVTHVWYLKGNPSYLSILLDIKKRHLEYITYCSETLTLENALKGNIASSKSSDIISSWNKLKDEIIAAKEKTNQTEKKIEFHAHFNAVENKIEKREKLILKRHYYWKLFYNENSTKNSAKALKKATKNDSFNDWYNLLNSKEIQLKSFKSFEFKKLYNNTRLGTSIYPSGQIEGSKNNTSAKSTELAWSKISNKIMDSLNRYSKNSCWGLSELKILSFIITQEKEAKLKNNVYANEIGWQPGTAKLILKKISIPFYIVLNLNAFSQKSISKHVVNTAWRFALKKALKLALIRINKIFNKIQTSNFQQNFLNILKNIDHLEKQELKALWSFFCADAQKKQMAESQNQTKIEELNIQNIQNDIEFLSSLPYEQKTAQKNKLDNKTINSYYLFLEKAKIDFYRENNEQDKSLANSYRDSIKLLKTNFYNLLEEDSKITANFELISNSLNKNEYKLAPKLKSHFYLEFYTLSNIPTSLANFIISLFYYSWASAFGSTKKIEEIEEGVNILNNSVRTKNKKIKPHTGLDFSLFSFFQVCSSIKATLLDKSKLEKKQIEGSKATYSIILKNLSEIFFKNLMQNAVPALKSLAYENYRIKKQMLLNKNKLLLEPKEKAVDNDKIANQIKLYYIKALTSQNFFYFVTNLNKFKKVKKQISKDAFKKLKNNLVTKKEFAKLLCQANSVGLAKQNNFNFMQNVTSIPLFSKQSLEKNAFSSSFLTLVKNEELKEAKKSKKLYNNIYTLSHRERWEVENDWNFLYYFMTGASENLATPLIANYRERYSQSRNNLAESDYNTTFAFQGSGYFNIQKSAFFSGPGIIQQLLNEFNFYEIKKMDKQNRILLYQLNKLIFKLKKYASPINTTPIISRISTDEWGNSKSRASINSNLATKSGIFGSGSVRADTRNLISKRDRTSKKELKEAYKKRDLLIRRTKLVRKLFIKESSPQATILTILPVLPPDLRPIVKMGGQIAASDLNRLYQRVIYRNDRLKKFLKDPATSHSYEMKYAQRLLQEAVDNLIQNGKSGVVSEKDSRGRALKSLSDILKGKQGRFRQYLLGKRVDYSGRSVIVVGPKLKLHECGIPKEMAIELYLPFLLKRILNENLARTVVGAKTLIKTNPSLIWELLREIMQTCPVLLNRAPTLHRLGIQAFQPKLIDGRAILLHPLVCSAFNADFDGDQMAVHVPITVEARTEAWKLMLSRNNILSPATGDPLAIPSQDMVLGCYYLTTNLLNSKIPNVAHKKGSGFYFLNIEDALKAYQFNEIDLHANIWLKWNAFFENGSDQEEPIEIRIDSYGNRKEIYNKSQKSYYSNNNRYAQYILTTPGKILFNQTLHNFIY